MTPRQLRIGVVGLGRAFMLMLPTFRADPRVALTGAADPRPEARRRFEAEFGAPAYESADALCAQRAVDALYVASPHQCHAEHVYVAAAAGLHVLVEKPMALTLAECQSMIDAARRAGVHVVVGHSHSFDAPIRRARELIVSGEFGRLRMITALNFTDFIYRPRRPEELDTRQGGGVVFSQAAHQIDVVRLLGGGRLRSVRASTGAWDVSRPTEGAYAALLEFDDGCFASLTYSGYAHFDTDEFSGWVGEMGETRGPDEYGNARLKLATAGSPETEAAQKAARGYGGNVERGTRVPPMHHPHFGVVIASCERADLRPTPAGVSIYGDLDKRTDTLPAPVVPRGEVIDELYDAVVHDRVPRHSGAWGLATLEACLALLESANAGREIMLRHQVALE